MLVAILIICGSMNVLAQDEVKYCMSYSEFANDQWTTATDEVKVEAISALKRRIVQSSDFKINTGDKKLNKKFNKDVFALKIGDALVVNCRKFRYQGVPFGPGYAYAFRYDGNKLCVVNRKIGKGNLLLAGATSVLPVKPGIVAAYGLTELQLANKVCYLVDSDVDSKGKTRIQLMNDAFMNELLAGNEELKEQYYAGADLMGRESASNVLDILNKAGLIK